MNFIVWVAIIASILFCQYLLVFIFIGLSHVPGISNKGTGIHHLWTIPCSWDIQQGDRYSSSLDYPMFLGYPTRGDLRALINHYLPRKGENQMFVTLLCCCRYSPARSGWKQIKWGISISLTRFRGTPIHPTIQKKNPFSLYLILN